MLLFLFFLHLFYKLNFLNKLLFLYYLIMHLLLRYVLYFLQVSILLQEEHYIPQNKFYLLVFHCYKDKLLLLVLVLLRMQYQNHMYIIHILDKIYHLMRKH